MEPGGWPPGDFLVKIVTLVKQSPDVEAIRIDPKTGEPDLAGAGVKVSDYDKHAMEAAVQIKEKHGDSSVAVVSLGGEKLEESVKEALAMGGDEAFLLQDAAFENVDSAEKARVLAAAVQKVGDVDLVLAAEESADSHSAQTAPRVAAQLNWPLVSYATELEIDGNTLKATREVDEGLEVVEVELPAVVSVLESANEPRLPALMQILQAKNKPRTTWGAGDLDVGDVDPKLVRVKTVAPKSERKQQVLEADSPEAAAEELAKILAKEGVI